MGHNDPFTAILYMEKSGKLAREKKIDKVGCTEIFTTQFYLLFIHRAAEMEAYLMNAMKKVKQQIDDVAKRINGMLDGCRHKAHLSPRAEDLRKKVQALCVQAGKMYI